MWRSLLQKSISGHVDAPLPTKTGQLQLRAFARPFSPHPDAQPNYTQRMTHYAHTPIPLDFMSETRFMTEKSPASATRQPAICRGDRSGRPSNKQRASGQCRRSVSTRPARPSDRNRLFQPASYPLPRPENGKIYENRDSLHTVYIHVLPFLAISRHFLPFFAISRRYSAVC